MLAVASARLIQQSFGEMIRVGADGSMTDLMSLTLALLGCSLTYVVIVTFGRNRRTHWEDPLEAGIAAGLASCAIAGLLSHAAAISLTNSAPVRTAVLMLLSVALAWASKRWQRLELAWIACLLVAIAGAKLITEDFRLHNSVYLFPSLFLFGSGLIILPRLLRRAASGS